MNIPVNSRKTLTVILTVLKGTPSIHFCDTPLSGADNNLWMPVNVPDTSLAVVPEKIERSHLHAAIEQIMIINNVAHNVVHVEEIMRGTKYLDYRVTYNCLA
ncbi:hypothetical protein KGP17_27545 (plasmid) [Serratia sp. JSRIV001]|jgi:hypothetical protein|uniref:hypothetical protein n=1 Tax=Serratia TaxID=613 RepID=UPI001CC03EB1|nr:MULTISPECIES: hypothetical protein [unclassified Serratia (in: enterobacteria)]UAN48772.1 hypothetical protein KGP17_27545 [Serratia sp. JSRIV001]UAN54477.1 hypothetical protein KGP26_28840 [Serratia sp. JSRIV002]UAN60590.1 hypothetical protein KGP21_29055 [Serratia sp. JSRIV004]